MHNDRRMWLFEEQWQVDWLRTTALLTGFKERTNSFMVTLQWWAYPDDLPREITVYPQDPLPNAYTDTTALEMLITDATKRINFIEGRKDEFFADSPA